MRRRFPITIVYPDAGHYYRVRAAALRRVAAKHDTPALDVLNAALILERLADNPKAMRALSGIVDKPGPKANEFEMVVDALIQREIGGHGKAHFADAATAQAWGKKHAGTVTNAVSRWRAQARAYIRQRVDPLVGSFRRQVGSRPPEYWTRDELLLALSMDIRDENELIDR